MMVTKFDYVGTMPTICIGYRFCKLYLLYDIIGQLRIIGPTADWW